MQLAQKITEAEFVQLVNQMISARDIIQIRQCLSVPLTAITQSDIDKLEKEKRDAEMAAKGLASTTSSCHNSSKLKSISTQSGSAIKDLRSSGKSGDG